MQIFLGLAFVGLVVVLLVSPKPWDTAADDYPLRILDSVSIYSWWAGALNAALLGLAAVLVPFWMWGSPRPVAEIPHVKVPQWFWPVTFSAVLVCAGLTFPRLDEGLWDDEAYTVRTTVAGYYKIRSDGSIKHRSPDWQETIWYFKKPNNHILNSFLARIGN